MAVGFSNINKPLNPRGNDASPKGYNRAALYSGKALDFDGVNDSVTTSSNLDISNGSDLSYVSYFKTTETTAGYLFENNAFYVAIRRDDFNDGGTRIGKISSFISSSWLDTDLVVNDDHWHQCAMTLSNGTQKIYIDGQEIASATGKSYNTSGQAAPQIGARDTGFYFDGQIANTRVFNVGLTAAQVADLYNNPEKIVPTGVSNDALKLWLPMMEGAGTTAYDGSGNGNHGTISGATYVNGVGSPVAQTAVIDWNKGTNELQYSEDFSAAAGWSVLTFLGGTLSVTNNYAEAPDGRQTAARIQATHNNTDANSYGILSATATSGTTGNYVGSFWVKSNTGSNQTFSAYVRNNLSGDTHTATSEWTRIELQGSGSSNYLNFGTFKSQGSDASIDILVWGGQINDGTAVTPYTPTIGTTQPNDVLLPQGLTSGRDITGVNLFENVRKQGALNLDGNSWAEVHDNASLDITDDFTLEAWIKDEGIGDTGILGKWYGASNEESYLLYRATDNRIRFYVFTNAAYNIQSITTMTTGNWYHIVGTYDGSNFKIYMNGTLETTAARTGNVRTTSKELEIGRYYDNSLYSYNDQIAQPRIYNRALTAEEVLQNYNSGKSIYQ